MRPDAAFWHSDLGEFVLPYAAVRERADRDGTLLDFLEGSYGAVADLGDWDRDALEIPQGRFGRPYDVEAERSGSA